MMPKGDAHPEFDMDAVQEKNTFIHVPSTPEADACMPPRTTPAAFAPTKMFRLKRPQAFESFPEEPVSISAPPTPAADPTKVGCMTVNTCYLPTPMGYFGDTPTTTRGMGMNFLSDIPSNSGMAHLKLEECLQPQSVRTAAPPAPLQSFTPSRCGASQAGSLMSSPHGYQAQYVPSPMSHTSGFLPMTNSAIANSLTPVSNVALHGSPDFSWTRNVEIALAAESAKISAPYTAVGMSLKRSSGPMAMNGWAHPKAAVY